MAFEKIQNNVNQIQEDSKAYIDKSLAYYKLKGFKLMMQSMTLVLKYLLISLCSLMFLFFGSVAAALAIGEELESYPLGFLVVGTIYLIITVLLFFIKDKLLEGPILGKFSEIFFND